MALDRNAGGHAFDFDSRACTICGMTREEFGDKNQPACTGHKPEKIFADASQPATLRYGAKSVDCATLGEAVAEWHRLSRSDKAKATIRVHGGTVYIADQIDRLYHG